VLTGIEPTTSGLLDQRRSRSDNQAPKSVVLVRCRRLQDLLVLQGSQQERSLNIVPYGN